MDTLDPPPESLIELQKILLDYCSFSYQINSQNTITKEQSLVVKDIEKIVQDNNEILAKILVATNDIFDNETYLSNALSPTILKKEGVSFVIEQESLIRYGL